MEPSVSIILPTYNRAAFLPQAFKSIRSQTFTDWELVIVDDGSTDNTREVVTQLAKGLSGPLRFISQENQGPGPARDKGIDNATGRYFAFFDSDDVWLPHHLKTCVAALDANPGVDWVYAASRRVEFGTGRVLAPNSFYVDERPRPFLRLNAIASGNLRIIDDPRATACMIMNGLYCGFQNSVLRRRVFREMRIPALRCGEDQMFAISALAAGFALGYVDDVHVVYHVHEDNSSASGNGKPVDERIAAYLVLTQGYESLASDVVLSPSEQRALRRRLGRDYFWTIGYSLLWRNGRRSEALAMFRRGLKHWPWSLSCWKTYCLACLRTWVGERRRQKMA